MKSSALRKDSVEIIIIIIYRQIYFIKFNLILRDFIHKINQKTRL